MRGLIRSLAIAFGFAAVFANARAEDVHIIKLNLPDQVALKSTMSGTSRLQTVGLQNISSEPQTQSRRIEYRLDVKRIKGGFLVKRTAADPKADNILGADLIYTTDDNMVALRVENLDNLKAAFKAALAPEGSSEAVKSVYDRLFGSLTPESAASMFLEGDNEIRQFYGRPLKLNESVDTGGFDITVMGATITYHGQSTLTRWKEGQSAHVTTLMQPAAADLKAFLRKLISNLMGTQSDERAAVDKYADKFIDSSTLTLETRCDADVDLKSGLITHSDCDTKSQFTVNMASDSDTTAPRDASPHSTLPPPPKTVSVNQESKIVTDTEVLN